MNKAIVTTTIFSPTKALYKFAEIATKHDWSLIIVGDKKTPHKDYEEFAQQYECVHYLSPADQEGISKELSDLIGWDCIQRRNFGFVFAYQQGAKIIATVDDDNLPYETWGQNLKVNKTTDISIYQTDEPVFDPLSPIYPHLWHRGFPIQLLDSRKLKRKVLTKRKVLVQADLWDGDPDIDAVCRITLAPNVKDDATLIPYSSNKIMPFNSQNTFLSREVFPTYFLFPHIGRMDDIFAAYYTQIEFPDSVIFSKASVWQDRNEHDLSKDLEAEMIGYKHAKQFIDFIKNPERETLHKSDKLVNVLRINGENWPVFIPEKTIKAYQVWRKLFNG